MKLGDRPRAEKVSGQPIEKTDLIGEDYKQLALGEGTQFLTSTDVEVKKIQTSVGPSYLILDHGGRLFLFIGTQYQSRNDVLEKCSKGNRFLFEKFKQFVNVTLTRGDGKTVIATTKGKQVSSS